MRTKLLYSILDPNALNFCTISRLFSFPSAFHLNPILSNSPSLFIMYLWYFAFSFLFKLVYPKGQEATQNPLRKFSIIPLVVLSLLKTLSARGVLT